MPWSPRGRGPEDTKQGGPKCYGRNTPLTTPTTGPSRTHASLAAGNQQGRLSGREEAGGIAQPRDAQLSGRDAQEKEPKSQPGQGSLTLPHHVGSSIPAVPENSSQKSSQQNHVSAGVIPNLSQMQQSSHCLQKIHSLHVALNTGLRVQAVQAGKASGEAGPWLDTVTGHSGVCGLQVAAGHIRNFLGNKTPSDA